MLSFQLRVMAVVMMVAVAAIAATAWMTFRVAATHVARAQVAYDRDAKRITRSLVEYGQQHGGWAGVAPKVAELSGSTGQRIAVTTQAGTVIADTASRAGRTAPPLPPRAGMIDPRPVLVIADDEAPIATAIAYLEIDAFRAGTRLAACLYGAGLPVTVVAGTNGVPHVGPGTPANEDAVSDCQARAKSTDAERNADHASLTSCSTGPASADRIGCLKTAFAQRISDAGPQPLLLYLGPGDGLPAGPVIAAAALVVLLAAFGTALLSRRVLRPIGALTRAARNLEPGNLGGRVPVRGNDELAELTRSFNRMAESLQEGEERQRRLIADVAHELRTPLSNLRGYLEGLADGMIAPDRQVFVSLHDEALLQQRIVDDLQDLALAEAGVLTYQRTVVDVAELLDMCRTAHHARAETAQVTIDVDTDGSSYVYADPDRLHQVVSNLLSNAICHTPTGGAITLRCTSTSGTTGAGTATVTVADTGSGIAADELPHIFDRFWRSDPARGRTTGGSGLGLAIARQIITDHGGTITATSAPQRGTTITIVLPLARTAAPAESVVFVGSRSAGMPTNP